MKSLALRWLAFLSVLAAALAFAPSFVGVRRAAAAARPLLHMGIGEPLNAPVSVGPVDLAVVGEDIEVLPLEGGKAMRVVMKFGGSSLANAERVTYVAKLIKKHVEQGYRPVVVCSAMGKTTNTLLSLGEFALGGQVIVDSLRTMHVNAATQLGLPDSIHASLNELLVDLERLLEGIKYIGELTPRTKDTLVSFGERMAVRIVSATLNKLGVPAQAFDAWTVGVRTSSEFGNAEISDSSYENVGKILGKMDGMIVPVVTGFLGHDEKGRITTLGRGGSDLTATVLGVAPVATACWTSAGRSRTASVRDTLDCDTFSRAASSICVHPHASISCR